MCALVVRREQRRAELVGEREGAVLGRPDPLPAELDDDPVARAGVEHPTTDAVSGLEDHDGATRGGQVAGRGETRQPGAHDDDVGVHAP